MRAEARHTFSRRSHTWSPTKKKKSGNDDEPTYLGVSNHQRHGGNGLPGVSRAQNGIDADSTIHGIVYRVETYSFWRTWNRDRPSAGTRPWARKTGFVFWSTGERVVTPWPSGVVLCFTPSPLSSRTRLHENAASASAVSTRQRKPRRPSTRGLLPRSMSPDIPDSGSWHGDIATLERPEPAHFPRRSIAKIVKRSLSPAPRSNRFLPFTFRDRFSRIDVNRARWFLILDTREWIWENSLFHSIFKKFDCSVSFSVDRDLSPDEICTIKSNARWNPRAVSNVLQVFRSVLEVCPRVQ